MQENKKQVIVKMTARRAFRTEPIYQYDVGHELVFEGFELPGTFEVHFSLSPMGKSITQVGQNGVCVLPDMYAQTAAPIYAWLYIADEETGLTKYSIEIPVQRRAKPTDQQPTPVQQSAIDQAIAALNAGVEAAEDAQEAAEAAQTGAETAQGQAEDAAARAANSAIDADSSRRFADQHATAAQVAQGKAETAQTKAETAQGKAEAAQAAAEAAVGSYDAMTATATTLQPGSSATAEIDRTGDHPVLQLGLPQGEAGATPDFSIGTVSTLQPGQDATATITGTAAAPVLNLGIPQGDPGDATIDDTAGVGDTTKVWSADKSATERNSLLSAINDKADVIISFASGDIASFDDGADGMPVESLVVQIDPVQDLHGYDHPWPAAGGKNKFNQAVYSQDSVYSVGFSGYNYTDTITLKPNTQYTFKPDNTTAIDSGIYYVIRTKDGDNFSADDAYIYACYNGNLSGNSVRNTITTGSTGKISFGLPNSSGWQEKLAKIMAKNWQLEEGSTATAWSPYSNICPISGWTGVNVNGAGKNLLPCNFSDYSIHGAYLYRNNVVPKNTEARMTFVDKDTSVDVSGCSLGFVFSDVGTGSTTVVRWCLTNGNIAGYTGNLATNMGQVLCSNIIMYPNTEEAFNKVFARYNIMVEFGATATAYEAPNVQTIPIAFPSQAGTVYGGSLTVNEDGTGTLVVNRYHIGLSNASRISYHPGDVPSVWIGYESGKNANAGSAIYAISNMYEVGKLTAPRLVYYGSEVDIYDERFTDEATARSLLADFVCVYKLTTPITYDLTALEVLETLKGVNNIWSDANGDTSVTYRADTKLYIDNKITQAIAAALNS